MIHDYVDAFTHPANYKSFNVAFPGLHIQSRRDNLTQVGKSVRLWRLLPPNFSHSSYVWQDPNQN